MHISLNEVPTQKQLAMGEVTYKFIYMLKTFIFINVGQYPPFILQQAPLTCRLLTMPNTCIQV